MDSDMKAALRACDAEQTTGQDLCARLDRLQRMASALGCGLGGMAAWKHQNGCIVREAHQASGYEDQSTLWHRWYCGRIVRRVWSRRVVESGAVEA